jgi:hypothetical protein
MNVEDDKRSGHPRSQRTSENVEKLWNVVHADRHLGINAMAVQLNSDKDTVMCTEKDLNIGSMIGFYTITMLQHTTCFLSSSF